jgi:hypothetical protein
VNLSYRDNERASRLHRKRPGLYRVGVTPLVIRQDDDGSWGIYGDTIEGLARIPGAWSFRTLARARVRAFEYARRQGWA